uniref:Uncharacterized protein n=1 Tax=Arundo donax TaxID=35708 RepID=A0A0A8YPG5_ARUDO
MLLLFSKYASFVKSVKHWFCARTCGQFTQPHLCRTHLSVIC